MISVNSVSLMKSSRRLLDGLDFELHEGELLGVIGPNGAGKSSLLKLLAGLWQPTQGQVEFNSQEVSDCSAIERAGHIAWLAQSSSVAFDFSVEQVVALGPQRAAGSVMQSAMQQFGVVELASRSIAELSGGQQQRVHLARVFSQLNASQASPQLLLLDEPLNGLDIRWQQRCLRAAQAWVAAKPKRSAVMALHDVGLAASWCDRVLVLKEGIIEALIPPSQLDEELLERVWRYPLSISREHNQTLVFPKPELQKAEPTKA